MSNKGSRDLPHCPACSDDVVLEFLEETFEEQERIIIVPINRLRCPSCGYSARNIDSGTVRAGVDHNLSQMVVGQRRRMRIRGDGHTFKRFDHLDLKYDARDYFHYPRLGGEDQDGFLCPVFFDKDVLVYFNNHPKYRLAMRSSSAGSITQGGEAMLSHGFGINRSGKLFMWLGDIDRAFSSADMKRELDMFKAHNVESDHDLASTYFFSQLPGDLDEAFYVSDNETGVFDLIDEMNEAFHKRFGQHLLKVDITPLIASYRTPVLEDRQPVFQSFMSLAISLIENLDESVLRVVSKGQSVEEAALLNQQGQKLKGMKLLQAFLEKGLGHSDAAQLLSPLFVLHDLRNLHGHLRDKSFEERYTSCKTRLGLAATATDLEVHSAVVKSLSETLKTLNTLFGVTTS